MTAAPQEERRPLVIDATCLSHFARADRLDVLRGLLAADECWTTQVVIQELRRGYAEYPALEQVMEGSWLRVAVFSTPAEALVFGKWARMIGAEDRDFGEASVFAVAELRGGTAITDDRRAAAIAQAARLAVHGSIWLLARACRDGNSPSLAREASSTRSARRATACRAPGPSSQPSPAATGSC